MTSRLHVIAYTAAVLLTVTGVSVTMAPPEPWSEEELAILTSLWLGSLDELPADPTNHVADQVQARVLGQMLSSDMMQRMEPACWAAQCESTSGFN